MNRWRNIFLVLPFFCGALLAQTTNNDALPPGAPGVDAHWQDAGKEGVITSVTLTSKVWATLRKGVLTEVYYPTVDVANVQSLEFAVVDEKSKTVELESVDAHHSIASAVLPQGNVSIKVALISTQTNRAKSGKWVITKTYVTDPQRDALLIDVTFTAPEGYALYVVYDPSLGNSGRHDSGFVKDDALLASEGDKASALITSGGLSSLTSGYAGPSDGVADLRRNGRLTQLYQAAPDGNILQVARVKQPTKFTLALGFGKNPTDALQAARVSLARGWAVVWADYVQGWSTYLQDLRVPKRLTVAEKELFILAAMGLKAHEDKTYRGANVASLSVPWGGAANANEAGTSGYHAVWARDLYQVATAFVLLGDKPAAVRALDYLLRVQQKPDGSFPQNTWLDGRPANGSLQMDEVAWPLVLAYQLNRSDRATWTKHLKPAADFIIKNGPTSPQERWEENGGYSPSTIAAEIAGLVCAAHIAQLNGDKSSAQKYLAVADEWERNIEKWTATTNGPYGDGNYYLRVSEKGDPNTDAPINLASGGGSYDQRKIVDAGFLELVRLGIRRADDPLIVKSLAVVDSILQVDTPHGAAWYRYNHDGYGELDDGRRWNWDGTYTGGRGRLWPLLTGERGQYEIALAQLKLAKKDVTGARATFAQARKRLTTMRGFANDGLMLPEQVWDRPDAPNKLLRFGAGTGSATPLAWSMAQYVRLAYNLQSGRNLETPDIVAARYAGKAR